MKLEGISSQRWDFIIDHAEKLPQGIHLWYKGVPFSRRVYYDQNRDPNFFLRTLDALGIVKKYLHALTYLKDFAIPRTLNIKKYEMFLTRIAGLIDWSLSEFWIKDEEFSIPVWEIGKLIRQFLANLGFNEYISTFYARLAMMILEFDNAYRYRLQDLLGNIERLNRKTLKYIFGLYKQRESLMGAAEKINQACKILGLVLLIPKVNKALEKAHQGVDFNKIRLDKNDLYHTSYWRGYNFGGKDFDTRYQVFLDAHPKEFPPYHKRDEGTITNFLIGN